MWSRSWTWTISTTCSSAPLRSFSCASPRHCPCLPHALFQLLEKQFRQLEERLKRIAETRGATASEEALKGKLRYAAIDFLGRMLPEYKLLAEQLKRFLSEPEIRAVLSTYQEGKARAAAEEEREEHLQRRLAEHKLSLKRTQSPALVALPPSAFTVAASASAASASASATPSAHTGSGAFLEAVAARPPSTPPMTASPVASGARGVPTIIMVKPALVPLTGAVPILVQGEHLQSNCAVLVGGVRCASLSPTAHSLHPASHRVMVQHPCFSSAPRAASLGLAADSASSHCPSAS